MYAAGQERTSAAVSFLAVQLRRVVVPSWREFAVGRGNVTLVELLDSKLGTRSYV